MTEISMELQMELLLRLILAALCGFVIGYERTSRYKSAGVKTHMIVAVASALFMEISKYGFHDVADYDAARVAAQVVSGISFLGAGIIIKKNQNVEGLTTAALIWCMAGIGLALGAGMYLVGIAATILYLTMSLLVHRMEHRQRSYHASYRLRATDMSAVEQLTASSDQNKMISYSVDKSNDQVYVISIMLQFASLEDKTSWESSMLADEHFLSFERL